MILTTFHPELLKSPEECRTHYLRCCDRMAHDFFVMRGLPGPQDQTRLNLHRRDMFLRWAELEPILLGPDLMEAEKALNALLELDRRAPPGTRFESTTGHTRLIYDTLNALQLIRNATS